MKQLFKNYPQYETIRLNDIIIMRTLKKHNKRQQSHNYIGKEI